MPPPLELSEDAVEDLARLAEHFWQAFIQNVELLRADPEGMSRPSTLPYPHGFMVAEFPFVRLGRNHLLSILWERGDGGVILVEHIGGVNYA